MSSAASARSLYRSLLRHLPPRHPSLPRSPLRERLRQSFLAPSSSSAQPSAAPALALARGRQYLAYLRAQRDYAALVERYNPGMGMDEEERVRLTARRVGMNLPVEYYGGGEDKEETGR